MEKNQSTALLFEMSRPGRRCARLPECDVPAPEAKELLSAAALADAPPPLPEVAEIDLVRHFVNLSTKNMAIDTNFYPLGSCTMKYNPKRHERLAALPGLAEMHPLQSDASAQGMLEILWDMQNILAEIAGLDAVSLQPAAGAQGELTALLVAHACFRDRHEEERTRVPHPRQRPRHQPGQRRPRRLRRRPGQERRPRPGGPRRPQGQARRPRRRLHDYQPKHARPVRPANRGDHGAGSPPGALVYLDGANMNAILGVTRPGDFGVDMMHYNVHKTFTGPHGAGGPGAGPIAVREPLAPFLPAPVVVKGDGGFRLDHDRPKSIGRVRSFFGNVGILLRGWFYIRTLGPAGLREVSENAVLNANYLLSRLKAIYEVPHGDRCMHEFVASGRRLRRERGVSAMDVCKRLLDFGYHAPTVYFPLVVPEALMIEPTETESKETLDAFADALIRIHGEDPQFLQQAPHTLGISRPDEVRAARQPILRWKPE